MVFACQPIVAENFLVLQILNEGKGFLTNKQSKAVKFQTMLVLFRELSINLLWISNFWNITSVIMLGKFFFRDLG